MRDTIQCPNVRSCRRLASAGVLAVIVVVCLGPRPLLRADIAKVPAPAGGEASPRQLVPVPSPTPWITIAKETSVVTGPVGPNGYVDYLAALNKAIGDGVTIDNNAAVLLVKAIELWSLSGADKVEFFRKLGIKPPPPAAGRFKDATEVLAERVGPSENGIVSSVPWSADEFPSRARWLTRHEQALEVAVEATHRSRCYFPLVRPVGKPIYDLPLPGLQALNQIGRALAARALLEIGSGKVGEARRDLIACHRLGRLVGSGPCLMHVIVGLAIDEMATVGDLALLECGKLSATDVLAYRDELKKLPPLPNVADHLDQGERLTFLGFATELASKQQTQMDFGIEPFGKTALPTEQMRIIWNEALRAANKDWNRWVAAHRRPTPAGRQQQLVLLEHEILPLAKDAGQFAAELSPLDRGRRMGRSLAATMLPNFKDLALGEERSRLYDDMAQLACALAAYRADVGRYPAALAELVPKYATAVPPDRFSGKPLQYVRQDTGYRVSSVGRTGAEEASQGLHELVVQMPLPRLAAERADMLENFETIGGLMAGAVAFLSLAAFFGITATLVRCFVTHRLSTCLAYVHISLAAFGLVLLTCAATMRGFPPLGLVSVGLFAVTAVAGLKIFIVVHRRKQSLSVWMFLGHGATAITALAILWTNVYRFDVMYRASRTAPLRKFDARKADVRGTPANDADHR